MKNKDTQDLLDDIELLTQCLQAIADLIAPGYDLQNRELDRVAMLLDFLNQQQAENVEALRQALA